MQFSRESRIYEQNGERLWSNLTCCSNYFSNKGETKKLEAVDQFDMNMSCWIDSVWFISGGSWHTTEWMNQWTPLRGMICIPACNTFHTVFISSITSARALCLKVKRKPDAELFLLSGSRLQNAAGRIWEKSAWTLKNLGLWPCESCKGETCELILALKPESSWRSLTH